MAQLTLGYAAILIALGVGGYFATGQSSWTALIPAIFGAVMVVFGAIALKPSLRKHAMHGAMAFALLGLAGTFSGIIKVVMMIAGTPPERPTAAIVQAVMAVLTIGFIALGVRSFIQARRNPTPT